MTPEEENKKTPEIPREERAIAKLMQWRLDNPERMKELQQKWLENNKGYHKEWYKANKERVKKAHQKYYKKNREKILARNKEWQKKNRKKFAEMNKSNKAKKQEAPRLIIHTKEQPQISYNWQDRMKTIMSIGFLVFGVFWAVAGAFTPTSTESLLCFVISALSFIQGNQMRIESTIDELKPKNK